MPRFKLLHYTLALSVLAPGMFTLSGCSSIKTIYDSEHSHTNKSLCFYGNTQKGIAELTTIRDDKGTPHFEFSFYPGDIIFERAQDEILLDAENFSIGTELKATISTLVRGDAQVCTQYQFKLLAN